MGRRALLIAGLGATLSVQVSAFVPLSHCRPRCSGRSYKSCSRLQAAGPTSYAEYMKYRDSKNTDHSEANTAVVNEITTVEEDEIPAAAEEIAVELPEPVLQAEIVQEIKEPEEDPPARVKRSLELELADGVQAETERMNARSQRMENLTGQLQRSMARKSEVEDMIIRELTDVKERLEEEVREENERKGDLSSLLRQFDTAIEEKQEFVEQEENLLEQMQLVKVQVKEPSIRTQIEAAMAKKADLVSIEVILLEDMSDTRDQLVIELAAINARADRMQTVASALPSENDRQRMRAYDWEDVQGLQDVLLESALSTAASDSKVARLKTKFTEAVRQKREVLGEVEPISFVPDEMPTTEIVAEDTPRRPSPITLDLSSTSQLTEKELASIASVSGKKAVGAIGDTIKISATSFSDYLKSPDAQSFASAVVDLVESAKGVFSGIGKSWVAVTKEFDQSTLPGEEITTFDKLFSTTKEGFTAIKSSKEVAAAIDDIGKQTKGITEAAGRIGQTAAGSVTMAKSNDDLMKAVSEALASVQNTIIALAGLGKRKLGGQQFDTNRLLGGSVTSPPPKPTTTDSESE